MGWMRTLLLGDIGNRLDIGDAERRIEGMASMDRHMSRSLGAAQAQVSRLERELGEMRLATQGLTRFLIEKKLISEEELKEFIQEVDAEDGVLDGRLTVVAETRRLKFVPGGQPFPKRPQLEK